MVIRFETLKARVIVVGFTRVGWHLGHLQNKTDLERCSLRDGLDTLVGCATVAGYVVG